jgi:hypothetical protein
MLRFLSKNKLLAFLISYPSFPARLNDVSRSGGLILFSFFFIPNIVFAASCLHPSASTPGNPPQDFGEFVCILLGFINTALPILVGLTLLVFFFGLARFIWSAGDEKKLAEGKRLMFWGIIALFIMLSVLGIINLLYKDVIGGGNIGLPTLPTKNNPTVN